jgi:predicted dehydrogenase
MMLARGRVTRARGKEIPVMVDVALLGVAHIHTPGFLKTLKKRTDVQVKSVWDPDDARGQAVADDVGARFFGDPRTILQDPQVGGVIVCSETHRHEELVSQITAAKKPLFVEKPLGVGARDAYAMADMIERAGVKFQTGYANRSWGPVHFVRDHLNRGTFGTVTRARYSVCHHGALDGWFDNEWRWMADPAQAGVGAFGDLGTHGLDALVWFFGDVERVCASIHTGTARYPGCDELGEATIVFKSGVVATLAASWDDWSNPMPLMVSGTEAFAAIINDKVYLKRGGDKNSDGTTPVPDDQIPKGWPHAFELFLDAVVGNRDVPLVGAREAAYRSAVMEAMYEASRKRTWVEVPSSPAPSARPSV